MSDSCEYARLAADEERPASKKRTVDHSAIWERLPGLAATNGTVLARIEHFAASKRISIAALEALGTRVKLDVHGGVELAWATTLTRPNGTIVSAIKYRPLGDKPRYAEPSSIFYEPLVIGRRESLDWFVSEGETDGARLFDLIGDVAAVLVLPAGAFTFKREWGARIPRGATMHLCHDADEPGDLGAAKAAAVLGGKTVRVRPPFDGQDWCSWDGDRDEFVALVAAARGAGRAYEFVPFTSFLAHPFPQATPLLGEPGQVFLAIGSLLLVYGGEGTGKSTWTVDGIAHLAAGRAWLGIPVPRPVRFCVVENEGPPSLFQQKLAEKAATWEGSSEWTENVYVFQAPWGEFSFADADARLALAGFCDEHDIDVVTANPTLGLGVADSGRPDETQRFVDWLVECGLKSTRAFWLLHHENKAGQISGDWGRHPDTKAQLQLDGNQPRTKLSWEKTRWAVLPTESMAKACILEWVVETKGYTVLELTAVGASDSDLEDRIADYLCAHPWASTRSVWGGVQGTNDRIRRLLDGDRFDCVKGPRGSVLESGIRPRRRGRPSADAVALKPAWIKGLTASALRRGVGFSP